MQAKMMLVCFGGPSVCGCMFSFSCSNIIAGSLLAVGCCQHGNDMFAMTCDMLNVICLIHWTPDNEVCEPTVLIFQQMTDVDIGLSSPHTSHHLIQINRGSSCLLKTGTIVLFCICYDFSSHQPIIYSSDRGCTTAVFPRLTLNQMCQFPGLPSSCMAVFRPLWGRVNYLGALLPLDLRRRN